MSHKATNWFSEIPPASLTSGEFRVLFFLADCHNPSRGCFPEQEFLRGKTGLSNGGLNKCLNGLESKKLIRRKQRFNTRTKTRLSTLYVLGCDEDLTTEPTPQSGDGPNSTFGPNPTPLLGQSQLHPSGDKPVSEPVKEPCASEADPQTMGLPSGFVDRFLSVYPRPGDLEKTEDALLVAVRSGATLEELLAAAKAYASEQDGNERRYVAYSDNWVSAGRWRDFSKESADPAIAAKVTARWVDLIKKQSGLAAHCSARVAYDLVLKKLVSREQCLAAGIAL